MSLLRRGKAYALTIYLGEADQWQGQSLYVAIVHLLRRSGCAGVTVMRAVAGFGAGSRLHEQGGFRLSSDASLVIQVIDQPARLHRLLPRLEEMLSGGLMTLQEIEVLKYTHARSRGLPSRLPVRQIMEASVVTVAPDAPIKEVVDLLLAVPFRSLPVVDEQKLLLGIIGTRDLVNAGILSLRRGIVRTVQEYDDLIADPLVTPEIQARLSGATAQEVMNRQVRTIAPDASVRAAAQIMLDTGLRSLPVVSPDNRLLGMLSRSDLFQLVVTSPLMNEQAGNITHPLGPTRPLNSLPIQQQAIGAFPLMEAPTVHEDMPVAEVIDTLLLSPLKRVFVVDAGQRVIGVISDVDVLARMREEERPALLRLFAQWTRGDKSMRQASGSLQHTGEKMRVAADLMNRDVITAKDTMTVQETVERMMETHRRVLPIVDEQQHIKGVVGRTDLLRILLEG
jgi:CBS domain-containing protein